jgi:hypothetical protein
MYSRPYSNLPKLEYSFDIQHPAFCLTYTSTGHVVHSAVSVSATATILHCITSQLLPPTIRYVLTDPAICQMKTQSSNLLRRCAARVICRRAYAETGGMQLMGSPSVGMAQPGPNISSIPHDATVHTLYPPLAYSLCPRK